MAGIGARTAQFRRYCSWASAAAADPQARARALDELRAFRTMTVWKAMDSHGKQMFEEDLAEAQHGKLEKLTEYVTGSCRDASSSPESAQ